MKQPKQTLIHNAQYALITLGTVVIILAAAILYSTTLRGVVNRITNTLYSSFGLTVETVEIQNNHVLSTQSIMSILNIQLGQPMSMYDPARLKAALTNSRWIKDVQIERIFPHTLVIQVQEYVPTVLWMQNNIVYVVSASGHLVLPVTIRTQQKWKNLVRLGGNVQSIHAFKKIYPLLKKYKIWNKLSAIIYVSSYRFNLVTKQHIVIKLPNRNYEEAIRYLANLTVNKHILDREVLSIDLRNLPSIFIQAKHPIVKNQHEV